MANIHHYKLMGFTLFVALSNYIIPYYPYIIPYYPKLYSNNVCMMFVAITEMIQIYHHKNYKL
jgi:hypothetical protein